MPRLVHLTLAYVLFSSLGLCAQPSLPRFQHLTIEDGLSQDIVTSIAQDREGFMWFGTEDGLNRYDGYSVTVFKHNPHDATSLSSNDIHGLLADEQGRLWIGTATGPERIDPITSQVHHIAFPDGIPRGSANSFSEGPDSSIWLVGERGIFHIRNDIATSAVIRGKPIRGRAWTVNCERDGSLWISGQNGLSRYRTKGDTLIPLSLPPALSMINDVPVSCVFRDSQRSFWVCTGSSGIYRFDSALTRPRNYRLFPGGPGTPPEDRVRNGIEDRSGRIWFGTQTGLAMLDPGTGDIEYFAEGATAESELLGSRVYSLFVDRTGILWVGTYRGGINMYAPALQKFRVYSPPNGSGAHDVFALAENPDGSIVAGTDGGLFVVQENGHRPTWARVPQFGSLPISAISRRRNGSLWVGTNGAIMKVGSGPERRVSLPAADPVHVLFEDEDSRLWVGTDTCGTFVLDDMRHRLIASSPGDESHGNGAWSMFQDKHHRFWIGTWGGEWFIMEDRQHGTITRYGSGPRADVAFPSPSVRAFCEDSSGVLWLGTWGGGLFRLDTSRTTFQQFGEPEGLPSVFVKSIEMDRKGRLWIGTERGLSRYDPTTAQFSNFLARDGLLSSFFYSGSSLLASDGTMYFGSPGGFIAFNPDSIPHNTHPPVVVITAVKILDQPVPPSRWASGASQLRLQPDEDFFSFEFVALDFTDPASNRYAYKLEGFDKDWIDARTRRYAAYTHLDPGTYRFRVKGSNNDGVWNESGTSLSVVILPAFWMTWWFRAGVSGLLLLVAYAFYRSRVRTILEVEGLRLRIARDLHDDIGTNLSAIVLASEMGKRSVKKTATPEAFEDIRTMAMLTQEHMRDIVWMLNPRNDSTPRLLARMKDDAGRLLRAIPHTFQGPPGALPGEISLAQKRNLFLIYKEALHNILKHSRAKHVDIAVGFEGKALNITITDDGRGFDPDSVARGNGLDSMTARAAQIQAELRITSHPGRGTTVQLRTKIT